VKAKQIMTLFLPNMLKERIIGIVLVLIFSFQLAPILQVGSFLYQGQLTEELPHHSDSGMSSGKLSADSNKNFVPSVDQLLPGLLSNLLCLSQACSVEAYSSRQADDVQTPPPNFSSPV
jgi:hypothetical protein